MYPPISLTHLVVASIELDRRRTEARRHEHRRAVLETRIDRPTRLERLQAAVRSAIRRDDHSLTDQLCRLPDGRIGRVAVVLDHGEWTLVCRVR